VGESGSENARTLGALINDAAEFVWKAGPLVKGPGICHGTAGNGYTFIALYRRTGSPHWLERARRFAMPAKSMGRDDIPYGLVTADWPFICIIVSSLKRARFPGWKSSDVACE
jgi:hypothetical protein